MTTTLDRTAVTRIVPAFRTLEGEGMEVRRAIPARSLEAVGPFIFLDHFGPIDMAPGKAKGAPNHPHRGFETLTYLLEGRGAHRDSLGNISSIGPGEAQWMRAGSGILHDEGPDERIRREGGRIHGLQFWINLPKGRKLSAPDYRQIDHGDIPELVEGGARLRLIAGSYRGATGPVETFADPFLVHAALGEGDEVVLDFAGQERAVYVARGSVGVGECAVNEGELAILALGTSPMLSGHRDADVFLVGGPPLDAPIRRYGPFVMNTDEELADAVRDFQAGKFGQIA